MRQGGYRSASALAAPSPACVGFKTAPSRLDDGDVATVDRGRERVHGVALGTDNVLAHEVEVRVATGNHVVRIVDEVAVDVLERLVPSVRPEVKRVGLGNEILEFLAGTAGAASGEEDVVEEDQRIG